MNLGGFRGEPTLDEVRKLYPEWDCKRGAGDLFYASHKVTGQHVHGEDPLDLADQIKAAEAYHAWLAGLAGPVPWPKPALTEDERRLPPAD